MTTQTECAKCKVQVTPNEKMECPTCKTALVNDPFAVSCANFASMIKTQMVFGVPATLQSMITRNAWGQMDFGFSPMSGLLISVMAVMALAWFMVRQKAAIYVWGPVMVGLAGLSLLGRVSLVFGDHAGVPGFALIFVVLGALVDVCVAALAIGAFNAWRQRHNEAKTLGVKKDSFENAYG